MRACAVLLLAAACAGGAKTSSTEPVTRYRVGDEITYRYEGSFSAQPVMLHERIVSRAGNVLRIAVTAKRGDGGLQWIQQVTDTPENQKAEKVDALEVLVEGTWKSVPPTREELYRLYAWTIPPVDGAPADVTRENITEPIAGTPFACDAERGRFVNTEKGTALKFRFVTCPGFLWTNGPAEIVDEGTGQLLWSRSVVAVGKPGP